MVCSLVSIYFDSPLETLDYWFGYVLSFDFLEKSVGIASPPHFVYDFLRKMFLMIYSNDCPNLIVWLSLFPEILGNTFSAIVC